jgi:hypothetical protein
VVTIGCSVGNVNGYSLEWYRNGVKLVDGAKEKDWSSYNISTTDNTLTINRASKYIILRCGYWMGYYLRI